jgi:phosphatidylglycerol:prolipoprotein diacylglycerol transferase
MYPCLLTIGSRAVSSYGFFMILGYTAGIAAILILAHNKNMPIVETSAYVLFAAAASIIGGKLFLWASEIVRNPSYYSQNPQELWKWPHGGGATYGAVAGAALFSLWYLKKFHLPVWPMGDIAAPGIALAQGVMKIGCFSAGCCYGTACSLPWAVSFPNDPTARHPTQLYESGLNFFNFLFLLFMSKRKRFDGQIIALYLIDYSILRFTLEYFRGDAARGFLIHHSSPFQSISVPQLFSLISLFKRKRSVIP